MEDFEVVKPEELKALKDRVAQLELEVLSIKRAAATGAWCRRDHKENTYSDME
jgi:hypothetical protein